MDFYSIREICRNEKRGSDFEMRVVTGDSTLFGRKDEFVVDLSSVRSGQTLERKEEEREM